MRAKGLQDDLPSYAVIFRIHFWDDFARRQLERLQARVKRGHIHVLVDETRGPIDGIDHERVMRVTADATDQMGLIRAGNGPVFWYNGDYPLYCFALNFPDYAYYICFEYDTVINVDLDDVIRRCGVDQVDFVALTKGAPVRDWTMVDTCRDFYAIEDIAYKLICFSIYSRRALEWLYRRRIAMADQYKAFCLARWPFCEAFVATEMQAAGFLAGELVDYMDVGSYDHWPPFIESDLHVLGQAAIVHPVLDSRRYIDSMFKYPTGLKAYFQPRGLLHRKLRRLPLRLYLMVVIGSFIKKATRAVQS